MKKHIIWLASYPKSGNTWFRSFLSSLLHEKEVDINDIEEGKIFSRRNIFENTLDVDSTLLSENEIRCLQPIVFTYLNSSSNDKMYIKIHDSFITDSNGTTNVPEKATLCAIYLVRNPLDVCISYANHNATTIETTIQDMNNENYKIGSETSFQFLQPLLSWSNHFLSWNTNPNFPVHLIRYEDMLNDTFNVFKGILLKIGLDFSDKAILDAIEATSFEKLKKQEEEHGFRGKNPKAVRFFNNGKSGTWKGKLEEAQIERIIADHGTVMKKLGYL
jgi:Sulfotransferase domain